MDSVEVEKVEVKEAESLKGPVVADKSKEEEMAVSSES